ncbi:MAG: hypothetical protein ACXABK_03830 [Candidatus Heimdallarchaeaceae archaeon]|jgi:DNA-binding transcriptional ArsR family regulator
MEDYEKIALEAFERGKKESYVPQDPFVSFGFEGNPFFDTSYDELRDEAFLQPRIRKLSHYIGKVYSSCIQLKKDKQKKTDSNILDGVLYGATQSGLSTLIQFTHHLLSQKQNIYLVDAKDLVVFENNQYSITDSIQNFRNVLGEHDIGKESLSLVIIDHSDYLIEFFESFRDAFERDFQDVPIIFAFTHSGWTRLKSNLAYSNYVLHNKIVQSVAVDSFTSEELALILKRKLSIKNNIQKPFSQRTINQIAKISGGSLTNAIRICVKLCEECFYNGLDMASTSLVNDVSSILGIDVKNEFYDLITLRDNTQTFILSLIAMKSVANDFGITYDEIVMNLDIQKTSASHHLKQLQEKRFVTKRTVNRIAYYKLREELQFLADIILLPNFEQKERFVRLENISDFV